MYKIRINRVFTRDPRRAATDPPPGAGLRAPTASTNPLSEREVRGAAGAGRRYSITLSLKTERKVALFRSTF